MGDAAGAKVQMVQVYYQDSKGSQVFILAQVIKFSVVLPIKLLPIKIKKGMWGI